MDRPYLIEFRNVTVDRAGQRALEDVTLEIAGGENVAILGPNGSGKSTLIKLITRECYPRLTDPPPVVRILGRERWNLFDLRAEIGIVTNDLVQQCTQPYTVRETVLSGFFGSIGVWPHHEVRPEMEERAAQLMEFLDIAPLAGRLMTEMSSGEVRRAVIARALAHSPKALVLDEPSNSLDIRATHELRESMSRLARAGIAVILVTHHLPDIIPEIGRVVCLRKGRISRAGPKSGILTGECLSELFETPVRVLEAEGLYHMW
jgi:iron complex transport system ATP-binding protein